MLTSEDLSARRADIDASADLRALLEHLMARAVPVMERMPTVPAVKALLSRDGGFCPDDGSVLTFDPWSPDAHRCATCGRTFSGARHHAHWARAQHLWIAERAAHLATLHAITEDAAYAVRARELLSLYYELYFALPNSDNVLGPSHLFFSTYLESIWILDFIAAAFLLRECGALPEADVERIDAIADEAATIIAEFNEGMSNRQTWNAAALTAIATWFGDEELALSSIEGRTGLLGHLADGFGSDGMWHEGENYHLFALRGLLIGLSWADVAGAQLLGDDAIAAHLGEALMAPADSALPDLTFPARRDARYGVSLSHPAYVESWEVGAAALDRRAPGDLDAWLRALYAAPATNEQTYDAYLHEAGAPIPEHRSRADLSWWALLRMRSAPLHTDDGEQHAHWQGRTRLFEQQGLAVVHHGSAYASLECGPQGAGGHGHPDRLHLTLHASGVHWLPDPGTGSYVNPDLFWYRSTLAHNAPMLNGRDQQAGERARCTAFAATGNWARAAGTWSDVTRTLVIGDRWMIDTVRADSKAPVELAVPWHLAGQVTVVTPGSWIAAAIDNEFVGAAERFVPEAGTEIRLHAVSGDQRLDVHLAGDGDLLRAQAPGLPGEIGSRTFYLRRANGAASIMHALLDFGHQVNDVSFSATSATVTEDAVRTTVQRTEADVVIASGATRVTLGGVRPPPLRAATYVHDRPLMTRGSALHVDAKPALDGTLRGFDRSLPLAIDEEHQYFRTELPWTGADDFSATAWVNWSDDLLYVAVDVVKSTPVFRHADAPALGLDNEPDDINADGVQIYTRGLDRRVRGWLVRPSPDGSLPTRATGSSLPGEAATGAWKSTPRGYCVTVAIPCPQVGVLRRGEFLGFDIVVNEMREGRVLRAGQLVWSGGPGWAYLRGDRHPVEQFGELEILS